MQLSLLVPQQSDGVPRLGRRGDGSQLRTPGQGGCGLQGDGAGDGVGCVLPATGVLIQRVLQGNKSDRLSQVDLGMRLYTNTSGARELAHNHGTN